MVKYYSERLCSNCPAKGDVRNGNAITQREHERLTFSAEVLSPVPVSKRSLESLANIDFVISEVKLKSGLSAIFDFALFDR